MKETIGRIRRMERLYDEVCAALARKDALGDADMEKVRALEAYMTGGEWMRDYRLDEQGALPKELKRGVLSQDGLYNLLSDIQKKEKRS